MYKGIKKTSTAPIAGSKVWYFIQPTYGDSEQAILPAHQTSGSLTIGGNTIDEQTKQGRILGKESDAQSISIEQYFSADDPGLEAIIKSKEDGVDIKVWRVIVDESVKDDKQIGGKPGGSYPAKFGFCLIDNISITDGTGFVSVSYTLNVIDKMKNGTFDLTDEDLELLKQAYDYENPGDSTGSIIKGDHTENKKPEVKTTTNKGGNA